MKVTIPTICLLAFLFTFQAQTFAATYTVTTTADSGAGSLRQSVTDANTTTVSDTVTFAIPAGNANCTAGGVCTITLTSGKLFAAMLR